MNAQPQELQQRFDADVNVRRTYDAATVTADMQPLEQEYLCTLSANAHAVVCDAQRMRELLAESTFARQLYASAVREVIHDLGKRIPYEGHDADLYDPLKTLTVLFPPREGLAALILTGHAISCIEGVLDIEEPRIGVDSRRTVASGLLEYATLAQDYARRLERQQ